jgi:thiamine-phosphate pyrophosphorylase
MRDSGRRARFPVPALILVTSRVRLGQRSLLDVLHEAVHAGVTAVQLREPGLPRDELLRLGRSARDLIGSRALFFVNGDAHVAAELHADGLHLPEAAMPVAEARAIVGEGMLISRAVHSVEAAARAGREGADIVQIGAIFGTESKPGATPIGLDVLREACAATSAPVVAIGGITAANAAEAIAAGAAGVAVIGAIFGARDVRGATLALRNAIAPPAQAR